MFAIIRVRGEVNLKPENKTALKLLRLHSVNHLSLLPKNEENMKRLSGVSSYATFGEIEGDAFAKLLKKRGRLPGNKRLDAAFLKEKGFKDFREMADKILLGKAKIADLGIKPVFRLGPPKKGYERGGIKKNVKVGGALGYRGKEINKLILRMA